MKRFIILLIAGVLMSNSASAQGWEQQNSPTANTLNAVVFVDSTCGWAVGDSVTIVHTTDGDETWTQQNSGITDGLNSVAFVDANNGWAVGGYYDSLYICHSIIVNTTDGGGTWTQQFNGHGGPLHRVDFVDANHGWAVGWGGTILHYSGGV